MTSDYTLDAAEQDIQNGKYNLVTSIADNKATSFDYFRSYLIDTSTGLLSENTNTFLGGYYESGFPKSPFWYEDLNSDGIKDLFISDLNI